MTVVAIENVEMTRVMVVSFEELRAVSVRHGDAVEVDGLLCVFHERRIRVDCSYGDAFGTVEAFDEITEGEFLTLDGDSLPAEIDAQINAKLYPCYPSNILIDYEFPF